MRLFFFLVFFALPVFSYADNFVHLNECYSYLGKEIEFCSKTECTTKILIDCKPEKYIDISSETSEVIRDKNNNIIINRKVNNGIVFKSGSNAQAGSIVNGKNSIDHNKITIINKVKSRTYLPPHANSGAIDYGEANK